jgi:hypothetical protein
MDDSIPLPMSINNIDKQRMFDKTYSAQENTAASIEEVCFDILIKLFNICFYLFIRLQVKSIVLKIIYFHIDVLWILFVRKYLLIIFFSINVSDMIGFIDKVMYDMIGDNYYSFFSLSWDMFVTKSSCYYYRSLRTAF